MAPALQWGEQEAVIDRAVSTSQEPALQVLDRLDLGPRSGAWRERPPKPLLRWSMTPSFRCFQEDHWRIDGKTGAAVHPYLDSNTPRTRMRKHDIRHLFKDRQDSRGLPHASWHIRQSLHIWRVLLTVSLPPPRSPSIFPPQYPALPFSVSEKRLWRVRCSVWLQRVVSTTVAGQSLTDRLVPR